MSMEVWFFFICFIFEKVIHSLVNTEIFGTFILVMIILNTICLCIQYPGIPEEVENSIAGNCASEISKKWGSL